MPSAGYWHVETREAGEGWCCSSAMTGLHALIARHGGEGLEPGQVTAGIETGRGPWVQALTAAGCRVYAVNPRQAARFKERYAASGARATRATPTRWRTWSASTAPSCGPWPGTAARPRPRPCVLSHEPTPGRPAGGRHHRRAGPWHLSRHCTRGPGAAGRQTARHGLPAPGAVPAAAWPQQTVLRGRGRDKRAVPAVPAGICMPGPGYPRRFVPRGGGGRVLPRVPRRGWCDALPAAAAGWAVSFTDSLTRGVDRCACTAQGLLSVL